MEVIRTTHDARRTTKRHFKKVGVLMGGPSTEREISLKSGKAVLEALRDLGLDVLGIDILTDSRQENISLIKSKNIECAFIALHGRFGEDGQIQEILEFLNIAYTGSGVEASRLAMDKIASKQVFAQAGLNVPRYAVINRSSDEPAQISAGELNLPLVIKPATHGSSIGLSIVEREAGLKEAMELAFAFDERVVMEEYIEGRELTVGILDDQPLPVIEIVPKRKFFDYEAKYTPGLTDYIIPAQLKRDIAQAIQEDALACHQSLGCFGCSRVDMILSEKNIPYILEVNTIPGLTNTSLLPKAAKEIGIEFQRLCLTLIRLAYEKTKV